MYAGTAICWAMVGCADATPGTAATRPTERVVAAASPAAPLAKYLRQGAAVPVGRGHPRWDGVDQASSADAGHCRARDRWSRTRGSALASSRLGLAVSLFGDLDARLNKSFTGRGLPLWSTDPGRGASIISRLPTHHGQPTAISAEQKTVRDKMADPRALGAAKERNTSHPPRLRRVRKGLSLATRRRVGPCRQPGWRQSTDQPSETTQARKSCWS